MENRTTAPHPNSAGSSSSTPSCSSSTSYSRYYDVFINHRGPDVKDTFASYLYRRLISNGLSVFLDREVLEEGLNITSQIKDAIRVASVHVAIFSPTYAESQWFLDELVLMVISGAIILPVFYKVEPSMVRWTAGAYGEALQRLQAKKMLDIKTGVEKPRYDSDTIQNWRNALSHVADKSGFVLHGDEGELLDKVVQCVFKNVPKPLLDMPRYPTGLDLKLQEFETTVLSKQQETERVEAKVVGVVGIGGVGKTTFGKEFFNREGSCYTASSFLSDVREDAARRSLHHLQSKLIKDLTHKDIIIGPHEGIGILRKHLLSCHVLIILDDVDHVSQLEAFLPIKNILSRDSLILVTSRDKHVLKSSGVLEASIYNLEGLNTLHSKELFCSYAFNKPLPPPEFEERELPWKTVEGETGERDLNKLLSTDGKCMFGLRELWMVETKISEVGFPMGVCSNLRTLNLSFCSELRQISGVCGLAKLQSLRIVRCNKVKELSSFEHLISLEELLVLNCDEMKSIEGLGQLTKLRRLCVSQCPKIQEFLGVEHVMSLKPPSVEFIVECMISLKIYDNGCPKLKWVGGVIEQVQQQCEEVFTHESKADTISSRSYSLVDYKTTKMFHPEILGGLFNFLNLT